MPDLKLGSNWKSCGYHYDMRRFNHGNSRINFGFSKGDDNYGGLKRKELDDFCKSLGKTMNLVMYRMQDTENLRMKLRERRRMEDREKAAKAETRDRAVFERMERNRRWREYREKEPSLYSIKEDVSLKPMSPMMPRGAKTTIVKKVDPEKEDRRMKNRTWRETREGSKDSDGKEMGITVRLMPELICSSCQDGMVSPDQVETYHCEQRHNMCWRCWNQVEKEVCPVCSSDMMGRNCALEQVAALLFARMLPLQDSQSFTFTPSQEYVEATAPIKEELLEEIENQIEMVKDEKSTVSVILTSEEDYEEEGRKDDEDEEEGRVDDEDEEEAATLRRK